MLAPNTHVLLEANFGVPWAGVPLVAVNTRLSAGEVRYILEHSEAAVLVHDPDFDELVEAAARTLPIQRIRAGAEYEDALATAAPRASTPDDERSLLSVNYTCGTTGRPKGVMYHHRGAYLQALAMVGHTGLSPSSVHLWTLPMFHCNGWCFPWAVTAAGGDARVPARVEPAEVWRLLRGGAASPTSNGAPTVLSMLAYAPEARAAGPRPVRVATGGAPPSPAILRRMGELGFDVTHLYGLTETFGPAMICDWRPEWNGLDADEQARLKARQGVGNMIACTARVVDDGRRRRAGRRRDDRGDRAARQQRDARLPQRPGGDRGGRARRLVPHRRPRRAAPRRVRRAARPSQGRDHLRRREHRLGRGRAGHRGPSGGAGGRR